MTKTLNAKVISYADNFIGIKIKDLAWTGGLLSAIILAPAILAHTPTHQWITGTIVNMILFIGAYRLKFFNVAFIAIFPSSIALMQGLLPAPLVILIPYIITANLLLIITFQTSLRIFPAIFKKNYLLSGIVLSCLVKFIFLSIIMSFVFIPLDSPFAFMLTWPQLFTALAGGLISIPLINRFK